MVGTRKFELSTSVLSRLVLGCFHDGLEKLVRGLESNTTQFGDEKVTLETTILDFNSTVRHNSNDISIETCLNPK